MKVNLIKLSLFLFIFLMCSTLLSFDLSYDLYDKCSYINKDSRTLNFIYLKDGIPENLKSRLLSSDSVKYGKIPIENNLNEIFLIKKSFEEFDELYIYNSFNDSLKYLKIDGKMNFFKTNIVELNVPLLKKDENTPPSLIGLSSLSPDKIVYRFLDFRTGTITINNHEYFIGLINHNMDYSELSKTTFFIDLNGDGKFSEKDSLDFNGNLIKEIFNANDSFIINNKYYAVDSISVNGFSGQISELKMKEKYAVGFKIPEFKYLDENSKIQSIKNSLGKVTLIYWWAIGCEVARLGAPMLCKLLNKYKNNPNFRFISFTADSKKDMIDYLTKNNLNMKVCTDNKGLTKIFGQSVPQTIILDESGIIKIIMSGFFFSKSDPELSISDENFKKLDTCLKMLLKE